MPRRLVLALTIILAAPAIAQSIDPGEQAVLDVNRAILQRNEKIMADNAVAQAAYLAEVARVEAKRRANEASFAAATAAYEAKQARYDADMANWRAESARVAALPQAVGRPPVAKVAAEDPTDEPVICQRTTPTGSNVPGRRICQTRREWDRESAGR